MTSPIRGDCPVPIIKQVVEHDSCGQQREPTLERRIALRFFTNKCYEYRWDHSTMYERVSVRGTYVPSPDRYRVLRRSAGWKRALQTEV
jgi:hypothetical protein